MNKSGAQHLVLIAVLAAEGLVFSVVGRNFATRDNAGEMIRLAVELERDLAELALHLHQLRQPLFPNCRLDDGAQGIVKRAFRWLVALREPSNLTTIMVADENSVPKFPVTDDAPNIFAHRLAAAGSHADEDTGIE